MKDEALSNKIAHPYREANMHIYVYCIWNLCSSRGALKKLTETQLFA